MKKIAAERNYKEIRKVGQPMVPMTLLKINTIHEQIYNAKRLITPEFTKGEDLALEPTSPEALQAAKGILEAQMRALIDLRDDFKECEDRASEARATSRASPASGRANPT